MRIPWSTTLLGLAAFLGGAWLANLGWAAFEASSTDAAALTQLAAGVLLALLGALVLCVPLLVPLLYRIYGEAAFTSRGGACPVVQRCPRCAAFNFRGRVRCKGCGDALVWTMAEAQVS
ncbi:MAG: hypothetical protein LC624_10000 [Halobacteriales archaeon]|nr:hypothetical protein [Halobacteriales archaeon]